MNCNDKSLYNRMQLQYTKNKRFHRKTFKYCQATARGMFTNLSNTNMCPPV